MKAGIVYVLSNPSQPGLFKIGETGDIEARVKELSSGTSVAAPFKVEFTQLSYDCAGDEQKVHYLLKEYRYNTSREFFRLPLEQAITTVRQTVVGQRLEEEEARKIAAQKVAAEEAAQNAAAATAETKAKLAKLEARRERERQIVLDHKKKKEEIKKRARFDAAEIQRAQRLNEALRKIEKEQETKDQKRVRIATTLIIVIITAVIYAASV